VINLQDFVPAGYVQSRALGIDADGNIVGDAVLPAQGVAHAVLWRPIEEVIPEPAMLVLLGAGFVALLRRRGGCAS